MIVYKFYDEDTKIQEAWYDSSMFVYTKFIENETGNFGDLYVTFKGGSTYKYKDVIFEDYVLLLYETSNGSALNTHIKGKYDYEKVDSLIVEDLEKRMTDLYNEEVFKNTNTYLISGPLNTTQLQFDYYYGNEIRQILEKCPDAYFITGNDNCVDIMAQNFLLDELNINPTHLTVFYNGEKGENINPKVVNFRNILGTEEDMYNKMTFYSNFDIAFVLDCEVLDATAKNILRRKEMRKIVDCFL